jgi:hypothetical protein
MLPAGVTELENLFSRIISLSVAASGIALLVILTIAGFKFLTSGGEPKAIQSASQTVTWALLGMLFLIIAWLILQLIESFTGVHVTTFCIELSGCP